MHPVVGDPNSYPSDLDDIQWEELESEVNEENRQIAQTILNLTPSVPPIQIPREYEDLTDAAFNEMIQQIDTAWFLVAEQNPFCRAASSPDRDSISIPSSIDSDEELNLPPRKRKSGRVDSNSPNPSSPSSTDESSSSSKKSKTS